MTRSCAPNVPTPPVIDNGVRVQGAAEDGSVVHEKVPWRLAAIHSGDWLVKLLLITSVVAGRRA